MYEVYFVKAFFEIIYTSMALICIFCRYRFGSETPHCDVLVYDVSFFSEY